MPAVATGKGRILYSFVACVLKSCSILSQNKEFRSRWWKVSVFFPSPFRETEQEAFYSWRRLCIHAVPDRGSRTLEPDGIHSRSSDVESRLRRRWLRAASRSQLRCYRRMKTAFPQRSLLHIIPHFSSANEGCDEQARPLWTSHIGRFNRFRRTKTRVKTEISRCIVFLTSKCSRSRVFFGIGTPRVLCRAKAAEEKTASKFVRSQREFTRILRKSEFFSIVSPSTRRAAQREVWSFFISFDKKLTPVKQTNLPQKQLNSRQLEVHGSHESENDFRLDSDVYYAEL